MRKRLARPLRCFYCSLCSQRDSGQSGRDADDSRERISASSPATVRFVEQVHEYLVYRREVLRTPLRTLEAEIGISRSAVDKFHKLKSHPGKNWPKLRDWYMATRTRKIDEYRTPPELLVSTTLLLVNQFPNSKRAKALRLIAENYRAIHTELNEPQPEWLQMLSDLAEKEESA